MTEILNYYDSLAKSYDEDRFNNAYGKFVDKQERIILDKILIDKNELILDLACGSGRRLNYANFGIDASANMIDIARLKSKHKNLFVNDAEKTVLIPNSIDTIICFHFFMHLDQNKINRILLECNRVLKENGRIIFDIPSKKRREIFNFKPSNWHGGFSTSIAELNLNPNFAIKRSFGVLFFPIHRFPKFIRKFLIKIDLLIANSFLKEYSSYIIIEYKKK